MHIDLLAVVYLDVVNMPRTVKRYPETSADDRAIAKLSSDRVATLVRSGLLHRLPTLLEDYGVGYAKLLVLSAQDVRTVEQTARWFEMTGTTATHLLLVMPTQLSTARSTGGCMTKVEFTTKLIDAKNAGVLSEQVIEFGDPHAFRDADRHDSFSFVDALIAQWRREGLLGPKKAR